MPKYFFLITGFGDLTERTDPAPVDASKAWGDKGKVGLPNPNPTPDHCDILSTNFYYGQNHEYKGPPPGFGCSRRVRTVSESRFGL